MKARWYFPLLLLGFIFILKACVVLFHPSSVDGAWQFSSLHSFNRGTFWFNDYMQHGHEHFFTITYLLSPVLNLLGESPSTLFYFLVYILNSTLLLLLFRPKKVLQYAVLLVYLISPFFYSGRMEDIALLVILAGILVVRSFPEKQSFIVMLWMMLTALIHPASFLLTGIFSTYWLLKQQSVVKTMLTFSPGILVAVTMLLVNWSIYLNEVNYRAFDNRFHVLAEILVYLAPILAVLILIIHRREEIILIITLLLALTLLGKSYYTTTMVGLSVFFVSNGFQSISFNWVKQAGMIVAVLIALWVFPVNKMIQWAENPAFITQHAQLRHQLEQVKYPSGHLFAEPNMAESFLSNKDTRFCLYVPKQNQWLIAQEFKPGDLMIVTDVDAFHTAQSQFRHQIAGIDTIMDNNIGPLLLSSGYQRRKNGVNLWVLKF